MLGVKSSIAALSKVIALLTLFIEVDKSPATWNRLWILAGMIAASCAVEFAAYRGIAGRMIHLVLKAAASAMWKRFSTMSWGQMAFKNELDPSRLTTERKG